MAVLWAAIACGSAGTGGDAGVSAVPSSGSSGNPAGPLAGGSSHGGASATIPSGGDGGQALATAAAAGIGIARGGSLGAGGPGVGGTSTTGGASGSPVNTSEAGGGAGAASLPQPNELLLYDDGDGRLLYVNYAKPSANWTSNSGTGRDLQLVGGGRALLGKGDGWDEYRLADGAKVGGQHGFPGTEDAYRLADGRTMLASIAGMSIQLKFVSDAGALLGQITYPGYGYVRLVRPTAAGTYLISADSVVLEGNEQGVVVWQVSPAGARHVWKALRLSDGNTAITTGYGATLVVYDRAGKLLRTIGGSTQASAAQIAPWFYADFHLLSGGRYFLVNSQADRNMPSSVQLLAYDASGTLVWQQKQPAGVRSLEAAIVLDGLDTSKLNVEPEGQWIALP